jgi:MFS transporter, DHA1 family, tetracycline resistance protein
MVVWHTYAMIYLTGERGGQLPESLVAVLPTVAALVTIGAVLLSAERFGARHIFSNLVLGHGLWLVGALVFLLAPPGALWLAILWTLVTALSAVLFHPASLTYWANIVDDRQRAMIFSTATAVITLATLPAGPLAGLLYTLSPKLPFLATFGLQAIVLVMLLALAREKRQEELTAQPAAQP